MVLVGREASYGRGSTDDGVDRRYLGDRHRGGGRARVLAGGDLPRRPEPGAGERARPARRPGPRTPARGPAGGMADEQAGEIPEQAAPEPAGARGRHVRDEPATEGETPTRADIPAQPAAGSGRHAMPTQRTGDADRAERSRAGQGTPERGPGPLGRPGPRRRSGVRRREVDQGGQRGAVGTGGAVGDGRRLRPLQVQVGGVLPGEADPAVQLNAFLRRASPRPRSTPTWPARPRPGCPGRRRPGRRPRTWTPRGPG